MHPFWDSNRTPFRPLWKGGTPLKGTIPKGNTPTGHHPWSDPSLKGTPLKGSTPTGSQPRKEEVEEEEEVGRKKEPTREKIFDERGAENAGKFSCCFFHPRIVDCPHGET